jgi:LPS O-antigen subunit length determinant protein (WzzB/FepE family)
VSKTIENSEVNNNHGTNEQSNAASIAQQQMFLAQNQLQAQEDEIDLGELWRAVWAGKFTIIAISFIFAVASIFFALSKPDVYKASAISAPASAEGGAGGLGALAGQFGGLASMAGINLGGGGGDKTALSLEILKSRSFTEEQTKNMMLTKVKAEYVLKTIDPPQVPDEKAGPKRALIVVLGTMLGGMLSVFMLFKNTLMKV